MRERMIEMKCWWDDMKLQQRWAMQTEKKRACLLWDSGEESICCPSGWLSFFRQSSSVSFLSHTHSLPRPCSLLIYLFILQFPLSLPHCPRSISAPLFHFVAALNSPHQNTHSSIAHRSYHQMKYLPLPTSPKYIPSTWEPQPACALSNAYFCVYMMGGSNGLEAACIKSLENLLK